MQLFPRGLFEDALPPIALRTQVYSLVPDRTVADLQLVRSVLETFCVSPSPQPSASRALAKSLSLSGAASRSADVSQTKADAEQIPGLCSELQADVTSHRLSSDRL